MYVQEILARKGASVVTVPPAESIEQAAARMRLQQVGAVVVSEDGTHLRGLLSEKDVVRALCDHGPRALTLTASDYMQPQPHTCSPGDTVANVAHRMTEERARHMPVVEGGRLAGIISIGDIVKARLEEVELESATLRDLARSKAMAG